MFDYQLFFLTNSNNITQLPYSIFGMSHQGILHSSNNIGNQDASCIFVGRKMIIGSVSDGCTTGKNLNHMSYNQVGSHILSYLSVKIARRLLENSKTALETFLEPFQKLLLNNLFKILKNFRPYKIDKSAIIENFFSGTLILMIIFDQDYAVYHCGDGNIFINSVKKNIYSYSGKYFSSNLYKKNNTYHELVYDYPIRCVEQGKINTLENILISTDGFVDKDVENDISFKKYFFGKNTDINRGFDDKRTHFNNHFLKPILKNKGECTWPSDDATFISLKHID